MKKISVSAVVLSYLCSGVIVIHLLGNRYADRMMRVLEVDPSPDLYANNHGFQYVAFWYAQGLGWLIVLFITAFLFAKYLGRVGGNNT